MKLVKEGEAILNQLSAKATTIKITGHRFAPIKALPSQVKAWANATNKKQRAVEWQFSIDDARKKLKQLYPKIKSE